MSNTKITTAVIKDDAITTAKIADDAVTGALIADDVALAGNPTTTTQSAGNNTTRIATTAFVTTAINNLVDSAPSALDTLNELAAAMGDDANFSTTVTNSIATKLPLAGGTMTGDLILGDNVKLEVGSASGGDLQLYHDGSNSYIAEAGTGDLIITATVLRPRTDDFVVNNAANSQNMITATAGGAATLYHGGSPKIATTSAGIDVTGSVTADGLDVEIADNAASPVTMQQGGNSYFKIVTTNSSESVQLGNSTTNPDILLGGGKVLIGTDSGDAFNDDSMLRLQRAGDRVFMQFKTDSDQDSGILFGNVVDDVECGIFYEPDKAGLSLTANNGNRRLDLLQTECVFNNDSEDVDFRVESNGNANAIFVNAGDDRVTFFNSTTVNTASGTTDGFSHYSDGRTDISRASGQPLNIRRRTDDGAFINFYKEASGSVTNIGAVGTLTSDLVIHSNTASHVGLRFGNTRLQPTDNTGATSDGASDLGFSNSRFKDCYLSGGIALGGTAAANKLDNFEQGSWTPSFSAGGLTITQLNFNKFTRVGDQVFCQCYVSIGGTANGANLTLSGLPFTVATNGFGVGVSDMEYQPVGTYIRAQSSTTQCIFLKPEGSSSGRSVLIGTQFNAGYGIFSFSYFTT